MVDVKDIKKVSGGGGGSKPIDIDEMYTKYNEEDTTDDPFELAKMIILYANRGNGKTVAAHTASEFCPEILPAKELAVLEDVVLVENEPQARLSPLGMRLKPGFIIPGLRIMGDNNNDKHAGHEIITAMIKDQVLNHGKKIVIHDTMTWHINNLTNIWLKKTDKSDTIKMWGEIGQLFKDWITDDMASLPCTHIFNFHKATEGEDKEFAGPMADGSTKTYTIRTKGKEAAKAFMDSVSMQFHITAKVNAKGDLEPTIKLKPEKNHPNKNRLAQYFPKEQTPPNLRKLFKEAKQKFQGE